MKVSDSIPFESKTTEERGLPPLSWFELEFADGSFRTEHNTNWSDISEEIMADYFGGKKTVRVCKYPLKKIRVFHQDLFIELLVPEGYQAYQAIRANAMFLPNGQQTARTTGRCAGLVLNGEVVDERVINELQHEVLGMKK